MDRASDRERGSKCAGLFEDVIGSQFRDDPWVAVFIDERPIEIPSEKGLHSPRQRKETMALDEDRRRDGRKRHVQRTGDVNIHDRCLPCCRFRQRRRCDASLADMPRLSVRTGEMAVRRVSDPLLGQRSLPKDN